VGVAVNFVALLAVLAATSFTLPLLVQGGEALGLGRGASVAASLVLALVLALAFAARAVLAGRRRRVPGDADRGPERGAGRRRRPAPQPAGVSRPAAAGLAEAQPQGLRAGLRLIDGEEESRAGL